MGFLSAEKAQDLHEKAKQQAAKNRADFPVEAEFVDAVRELFPGAKVKHIGKVRPHSAKVMGIVDKGEVVTE